MSTLAPSNKVVSARKIRRYPAGKTKAWDIECVGNHNFIGGRGLFLLHNTNNPEFEELKANPKMEAFRDRTVRVDIPYLDSWTQEINVLKQDFNAEKVKQHIAPHTIEIAALWAIMTRLHHSPSMEVSLVQKAKLYDGRAMPNWNEDRVKELKEKNLDQQEGLKFGISARFVQNAISNALVNSKDEYINPFMVLNQITEKLTGLMISDKDLISRYKNCVEGARKELDDILKEEVQEAIIGNKAVMETVFRNYIDNVMAHCDKAKIKNPITGKDVDPDESFMRSIEEMINVPETQADDYRRQVMLHIGMQSARKAEVKWDSDERLAEAIKKKVFEDTKDHIKINQLSSVMAASNKDMKEKVDEIRQRLIDNYGYNHKSAQDVLSYVSSLYSRGGSVNN